MSSAIAAGETVDSILGGRIRIRQPRAGYRFSLDSILLARFAQVAANSAVLELGAGCGVVSILIANLKRPREVIALEIQHELSRLIARNAELNGIDTISVVNADLRTSRIAGIKPGGFDCVVANPPYRALKTGRESPNPGRRTARGEADSTLRDFVIAAARYVRFQGRVALVFTAARGAELIVELKSHRLEPKRLRMVHPRINAAASTILIEARKGAGVELAIEPPLIIYEARGKYTEEARSLLFGDSR
jgi:tRNA1Val (adenine37-N6)-methyltransferase